VEAGLGYELDLGSVDEERIARVFRHYAHGPAPGVFSPLAEGTAVAVRWGSAKAMTMGRHQQDPGLLAPPPLPRVAPEGEERRRVIVILLRQHPNGLTAREIAAATGHSRNLTASALSGLFTRGVLHKRGHHYVLVPQDEAIDRSSKG